MYIYIIIILVRIWHQKLSKEKSSIIEYQIDNNNFFFKFYLNNKQTIDMQSRPFDGKAIYQLMGDVVNKEIPLITRKEYSSELKQLIMKMLIKVYY
jgi:hypothetical protein